MPPAEAGMISIVLPYLNTYRVPFLTSLHRKLSAESIGLDICVGEPDAVDAARNDQAAEVDFVRHLHKTNIKTPAGDFALRKLDKRIYNADLVIVEHAIRNFDSHVLLTRPRRKQKIAIWGHGHTITKKQTILEKSAQKLMARRADWYFSYTKGSALRAESIGIPLGRTTVVQNTVDTTALSTARSTNPRVAVDQRFQALFVGGLDSSKRIDFLLEAARQANKADPRFHLVVVGAGPERQKVECAVDEGWCTYLGRFSLTEKFDLVKDCQVILMPGRVGLAAVDSFAMASPIITTSWRWHAPEFEYLDATNSVVASNTVEAYTQEIVLLMKDSDRLQALQDKCAQDSKEYSIEDMSSRFADGCLSVLNTNRRSHI